jgi:hypothetical protein
MAHGHFQPCIIGHLWECTLPSSCATAMAPAPIGNDASRFSLGIHHVPQVVPPSLDTCDRTFRRILVHAHAHPSRLGGTS